MFKRTLALALFLSSTAHAADIIEAPVDEVEPTFVEKASFDWSGLRVGIFGGGTHSPGIAELGEVQGGLVNFDVGNGLFPRSINGDEFGAIGGIGVGYDQQYGNWVAGVEVDGSITSHDMEHRFSRIDPNPDPLFNGVLTNTTYRTDLDWLVTARVRLGYVLNDSLMIYGTGGFAMGDVTNRFTLNIPNLPAIGGVDYNSPDWSQSGTEAGFVIGAGAEKKLTENLRLTFAVEYIDLSNVNVEANDPPIFGPNELNYRFKNNFASAKMGLAYSF